MKQYVAKTELLENKKLVVRQENFPMDLLVMTWATPYEFWLISTIETGETRSIFITEDMKNIEWTRNLNEKFITKWGAFPYKDLPPQYFILNDTTLYEFEK